MKKNEHRDIPHLCWSHVDLISFAITFAPISHWSESRMHVVIFEVLWVFSLVFPCVSRIIFFFNSVYVLDNDDDDDDECKAKGWTLILTSMLMNLDEM